MRFSNKVMIFLQVRAFMAGPSTFKVCLKAKTSFQGYGLSGGCLAVMVKVRHWGMHDITEGPHTPGTNVCVVVEGSET